MGPPRNRLYQNLGHIRREPKYSFGMRRPDDDEKLGPGPEGFRDTYGDINGKFVRSPNYSFGTPSSTHSSGAMSARGKTRRPGPGSYNCPTPDLYQKPKSPSWGFGGTTRRSAWADGDKNSPGPAMYGRQSRLGGAEYTMGVKRYKDDYNRSQTPGPAEYKVNDDVKYSGATPPHWGRPPSAPERPRSAGANAPGPGSYVEGERFGRGGPKWSLGRRGETKVYGGMGATQDQTAKRELGPPFTHLGY